MADLERRHVAEIIPNGHSHGQLAGSRQLTVVHEHVHRIERRPEPIFDESILVLIFVCALIVFLTGGIFVLAATGADPVVTMLVGFGLGGFAFLGVAAVVIRWWGRSNPRTNTHPWGRPR